MSCEELIASRVYWDRLVAACRDRIFRSPNRIDVLRRVSNLPLLEAYVDLSRAFVECEAGENWGRFVAFIKWLHRHPNAYAWWRRLVQEHGDLLRRLLCNLAAS